jgi:hypothetical protein
MVAAPSGEYQFGPGMVGASVEWITELEWPRVSLATSRHPTCTGGGCNGLLRAGVPRFASVGLISLPTHIASDREAVC